MATMGMNLGGAETHILELSKALVGRGHDVTVASNGGVFVEQLTKAGVSHVKIPLNRRSVGTMIKSYFALRRLILRGDYDIIHAHARIPSFLCGLICKGRRPFVTTAHFNFQTGGMAGRLTNWGQKTIAVSQDIKAYLLEHYPEVRAENISITVNGIDMAHFSPQVAEGGLREELGIPEDATLLLHVSRLDESPAQTARQLIKLAPQLDQALPGAHIVVIGGGDCLEELRKQANAQNEAIGRTMLHLTGGRTDIANCIAACDLFVGVSRAALEALSMEKSVILAGHQGYAGLFSPENLALCRSTNFTFRGEALPEAQVLLEDIEAYFALAQVQREALQAFGRQTVGQYYSVERMAEDAEAAYKAVLEKPKKLLVSGYYGFSNGGDEAILDALLQSCKGLNTPVDVTVLSNTPEKTAQKHGVCTLYRFNIFQVLKAIWKTDLLISGGGSLLQDRSSTRSILYYLSIIRMAKMMKKQVFIYANGIGPVSKPQNRRRVKRALTGVDYITLREESSREELAQIGVVGEHISVTADPIFLLGEQDALGAKEALASAGVPPESACVGISVRSLRTGAGFVENMAKLGDKLSQERGLRVLFLPMQSPADVNISREIMDKMQEESYLIDPLIKPEAYVGVCARCEVILAMRLHTMLFAAKANTPTVGLICDPKIEYFLEKLAQPSGGVVEEFDPEKTFLLLEETLAKKESYQANLEKTVAEMRVLAQENNKRLEELLAV